MRDFICPEQNTISVLFQYINIDDPPLSSFFHSIPFVYSLPQEFTLNSHFKAFIKIWNTFRQNQWHTDFVQQCKIKKIGN